MLVSVYVSEDKVIETYLRICCWKWQGFVVKTHVLLFLLWASPWDSPEESAFSSTDKPNLQDSWSVDVIEYCCLGLGSSLSYRYGGLVGQHEAEVP